MKRKRPPPWRAIALFLFVSFVVLVDFTVRDRAALGDELVAELAPRFPCRTLSLNFDTDYSD